MNRFQSRCVMFCVCAAIGGCPEPRDYPFRPSTGLFSFSCETAHTNTTREFRREFVVIHGCIQPKSRDSRPGGKAKKDF